MNIIVFFSCGKIYSIRLQFFIYLVNKENYKYILLESNKVVVDEKETNIFKRTKMCEKFLKHGKYIFPMSSLLQ